MTDASERYAFVERDPSLGPASLAPLFPITLTGTRTISVLGLGDTGATVNVLPHAVGEQLGAIWEKQSTPVKLTDNLAACEARALIVSAVIGKFPEVRLAFARARTDDVPILLGQVNFFMEFDVCSYRSRSMFEVRPKHSAHSRG